MVIEMHLAEILQGHEVINLHLKVPKPSYYIYFRSSHRPPRTKSRAGQQSRIK